MKLGENIRMYRNKANLTQEQLGEKVGVSAQAVTLSASRSTSANITHRNFFIL